jgi:hypothetical protein
MSELGFGVEELLDSDCDVEPGNDDAMALAAGGANGQAKPVKKTAEDLDNERDFIASLPVLVLNNFTMKASHNAELWNVLAEWGAGLVESKVSLIVDIIALIWY